MAQEKINVRRGSLILIALGLAGCTYIDQKVQIDPQATIAKANVGNGKKVALLVVDEREDPVIGKRGTGMVQGARITTDQDVVKLFTDAIDQGLRQKGFVPVASGEAEPVKLRVEVRALQYDTAMGLWTGANMAKATVKALATTGNQTYEKVYRSETEIRTAFVASQETNAKIINGAVSEVLRKMFADEQLLAFLAR